MALSRMTDPDNEIRQQAGPQLIAPAWHTAVTVALLLGVSALGARTRYRAPVVAHSHVRGYLIAIAIEWGMVAFVWYGLRQRGLRLRDLLGGDRVRFFGVVRDVGIAIVFLTGSNVVLSVLVHLFKATRNQAIRSLLPSGGHDFAIYLLLSLTAGICEEVVCRGYLQRQFTALTKSAWAGLVIQGIIFGVAHGYQGARLMLILAVYGCLFGLLARWRGSLRPGMMAHTLQDGLVGLAYRHVMK